MAVVHLTAAEKLENRRICVRQSYLKHKIARLARMRVYQETIPVKFYRLKQEAKKRELDMTLSLEEYKRISSQPCFYCGGDLPTRGAGIDRINSDSGYIPDNCRSCCATCNMAKSTQTETEFYDWIVRVFNYRSLQ